MTSSESEDVKTSASRPRGLSLGVMIATVDHDEYDISPTTGGRTDIYKSTTTSGGRRNPVNSTSEAWRSLPAAVWGRRVARYASPCITLIGLAGNALSFLVIRRQRPRQTSFSVYLTMIAVVDWGSLVTWAYRWSLLVLWPRAMTSYECRFNIGLKYAFRMAGYFFILLLTIDRFVVVVFPLRATQWCNTGRAGKLAAATVVASWIYALPYFILGRPDVRSASGGCVMLSRENRFSVVYMWSVVVTGLVAPLLVIGVLNSAIAYVLTRRMRDYEPSSATPSVVTRRKWSASVTSSSISSGSTRHDSQQNLIRVLFLVTFSFLVFNSPQLVRIAYRYLLVTLETGDTPPKTAEQLARDKANSYLAHGLTNNAANVNYSINFFLYFFSGTRFRHDLRNLFCCR